MEDEVIKCTKNVRVYKNYKMFAYDWLFYYAIQVLFLTIVKGFSIAQIMFLSSAYALSTCISQIIVSPIVTKLNNRKSIIIGNAVQVITCLIYIFSTNYSIFFVGQIICAFGFGLKNIGESNLLYGSLKRINKRNEFGKIEGIANSRYYYLESISGFISGYLFLINGYLPVILCLGTIIVSLVISLKFQDYGSSNLKINANGEHEEERLTFKEYMSSFKKIFKSNRMKSIFIFSFIFYGIVAVSLILYKSVLIDLGVAAQYIAIIAASHSIVVGVGAKSLYGFEKKARNKTLAILSISFVFAIYIIGFVGISNVLSVYNLIIIGICLIIMALVQGSYRVAMKKYVVSFTTSQTRTKIISLYYMAEGIGQSMLLFFSGLLLKYNSNAKTAMIVGILSFAIIVLILSYIKDKLGLKPEEYSKEEIFE